MDWRECIKQRIVKSVKKDKNLITSTREIAEIKIESAGILAAGRIIPLSFLMAFWTKSPFSALLWNWEILRNS